MSIFYLYCPNLLNRRILHAEQFFFLFLLKMILSLDAILIFKKKIYGGHLGFFYDNFEKKNIFLNFI